MADSPDTGEKGREEGASQAPAESTGAVDNTRPLFLKFTLAVGLDLAVGGIASVARSLISPAAAPPAARPPPAQTVTETVTSTERVGSGGAGPNSTTSTSASSSTSSSPFPRLKVGNLSDLAGGAVVTFNYPLNNTPNMLAKLGAKAKGGVGPDGDIVAFSLICQHLGCVYGFVPTGSSPKCDNSYKASGPGGYCCCHGSVYDLTDGAKVLAGPSPRPEPQVTLEFDSSTGDIYAVGMGPPTIFGHDTGSNNVLDDLQGGTLVG